MANGVGTQLGDVCVNVFGDFNMLNLAGFCIVTMNMCVVPINVFFGYVDKQ